MFTAYFDDSGTDKNSDIAVAACYISAKRRWDEFVDAWDKVRWEEGFGTDDFHMAQFVAPWNKGTSRGVIGIKQKRIACSLGLPES